MVRILISFLAAFSSSVGFGLITNVPSRILVCAGITGGASWIVYFLTTNAGLNNSLASMLACFVLGMLGILFSRLKKVPKNSIYVPGLVNIVPGKTAYDVVWNMVHKDYTAANSSLFEVILIAISLAGGLFAAEYTFNLLENGIRWYKKHLYKNH